ncbi:MAG: 30S ribosomal protein S6 [Planctomycetota bacterium]
MSGNLYEGMFLFDANDTARDWAALESHVGTLMTKHNAALEYAERWPDQRLAYEVKGVKKGTYYLTYFRAPGDSIAPIRRDAELSERILRLLVIREDWLEEEMGNRREAASQRAVQAAEAAEKAAEEAENAEKAEAAASSEETPAEAAAEATEAAPAPADAPVAEAPASDDGAAEASESPEQA